MTKIEWHEKPGAALKQGAIWGTFSGKLAPSLPTNITGATGELAVAQTITDGDLTGLR